MPPWPAGREGRAGAIDLAGVQAAENACYARADYLERRNARREKREPRFTG